jgi:hypothetical protein
MMSFKCAFMVQVRLSWVHVRWSAGVAGICVKLSGMVHFGDLVVGRNL